MSYWQDKDVGEQPLTLERVTAIFGGQKSEMQAPPHPDSYDENCEFSHTPSELDRLIWQSFELAHTLERSKLEWRAPLEIIAADYRRKNSLVEWDTENVNHLAKVSRFGTILRRLSQRWPEITELHFQKFSEHRTSATAVHPADASRMFVADLLAMFLNPRRADGSVREVDAIFTSAANAIVGLNTGDLRPFTTPAKKKAPDGSTLLPATDSLADQIRTQLCFWVYKMQELGRTDRPKFTRDQAFRAIMACRDRTGNRGLRRVGEKSEYPLDTYKKFIENHEKQLRKSLPILLFHLSSRKDELQELAREMKEDGFLIGQNLEEELKHLISEYNAIIEL